MRAELVQAGAACSPVNQVVNSGLVLNVSHDRCDFVRNGSEASSKESQDVFVRTLRDGFLDELLEYG